MSYLLFVGTFVEQVGNQEICSSCPTGYFASNPNQRECSICKVGFSTTEGQTVTCQKCDAGRFGIRQITSVTCEDCPTGFFQESKGQTSCTECELGQDFTSLSSPCIGCSLGKFGEKKDIYTCSQCPAGTFQDGEGRTDCKPCPINTYSNEKGIDFVVLFSCYSFSILNSKFKILFSSSIFLLCSFNRKIIPS